MHFAVNRPNMQNNSQWCLIILINHDDQVGKEHRAGFNSLYILARLSSLFWSLAVVEIISSVSPQLFCLWVRLPPLFLLSYVTFRCMCWCWCRGRSSFCSVSAARHARWISTANLLCRSTWKKARYRLLMWGMLLFCRHGVFPPAAPERRHEVCLRSFLLSPNRSKGQSFNYFLLFPSNRDTSELHVLYGQKYVDAMKYSVFTHLKQTRNKKTTSSSVSVSQRLFHERWWWVTRRPIYIFLCF